MKDNNSLAPSLFIGLKSVKDTLQETVQQNKIYHLEQSLHGEIHPVTASIIIVDGKLSLSYQAPVGSFKQDTLLMTEVLTLLRDKYDVKQIMCVGATDMPAIKGVSDKPKQLGKVIDIN